MMNTRTRVAIIDDDESVRKAIGRLLRAHGMDPECFASAEAFLESLTTRRPDCVLVDVRMPTMDGPQLLVRLRSLSCDIPAIVITAHDDSAGAAGGAPLQERFPGAVALVPKPFDDQILLQAIVRATGSRD